MLKQAEASFTQKEKEYLTGNYMHVAEVCNTVSEYVGEIIRGTRPANSPKARNVANKSKKLVRWIEAFREGKGLPSDMAIALLTKVFETLEYDENLEAYIGYGLLFNHEQYQELAELL